MAFGLAGELTVGLASALGFMVLAFCVDMLRPTVIAGDPPRRFAYARPDAVLTESRSAGLVAGLVFGLVFGLGVGLVFGLVFGVMVGLVFGLGAWLYHRWLGSRLAARRLLPARLPAFLEWCADDARRWLRISDAYEFRHRELLEHLAPTPPAE